jgi:RNase P subunit RPR2
MQTLAPSSPSPTATITRCPQCAAVMTIKLVEPDLRYPRTERHVFECQECGLPHTYLIDRRKTPRLAGISKFR